MSYRQGANVTWVGIVNGIGVMLAYRAEFAGHTSAGPQQLNTVTRSAFGTKAFRRFLAEADGLNAFNPLFGVAVSLFCFHCDFSILELGMKEDAVSALAAIE